VNTSQLIIRHILNHSSTERQIKNGCFQIALEGEERLLVIEIPNEESPLSCHYQCGNKRCSNSFIVPPVDILQPKYIFPVKESCRCSVISIFDNTSFAIPHLDFSEENIPALGQRTVATPNKTFEEPLFITASHVITVQCYCERQDGYFVQSILPAEGTKYKLRWSENIDQLITAISTDDNTVLTVSYMTVNDSYSRHVIVERGGQHHNVTYLESFLSISSNKPIILMALTKSPEHSPFNDTVVYIPDTSHILQNMESISTCLSDVKYFNLSDSGSQHHFRLFSREFVSVIYINLKRVCFTGTESPFSLTFYHYFLYNFYICPNKCV
jgi:hypothetical protein